MTTSNPFEPPRTTNLDGGSLTPGAPLLLGSDAERELVAGLPWAAWLARATSISIAVSLVKGAADFIRTPPASRRMGPMLAVAINTAISTWILSALRRYVSAGKRLRAGDRAAVSQMVAAQAGYFRLIGKLLVPVVGVAVLLGLLFVAGRMRR